jgi:hypothetical protein
MMEFLILAVIVLVVYGIVRLLALLSSWMLGARYRAYRQLARRFDGRYESRGMNAPPTVSFTHRGNLIRVGLAPLVPGVPPNPRTRVAARFQRGIPFRLELAPACRPAPPQIPKGTSLVSTGDREFDRGHVIHANDAEMARDFLTPPVRWAIGNLQRLVHPGGMLLSINPERLLVQIDRDLSRQADALTQVVSETLIIHEGLIQGVARRMTEGISIITAEEPETATETPICKVCCEPIHTGEVVRCAVCQTPHHRDCWEYTGSCSIYGCGGKAAIPVSQA